VICARKTMGREKATPGPGHRDGEFGSGPVHGPPGTPAWMKTGQHRPIPGPRTIKPVSGAPDGETNAQLHGVEGTGPGGERRPLFSGFRTVQPGGRDGCAMMAANAP